MTRLRRKSSCDRFGTLLFQASSSTAPQPQARSGVVIGVLGHLRAPGVQPGPTNLRRRSGHTILEDSEWTPGCLPVQQVPKSVFAVTRYRSTARAERRRKLLRQHGPPRPSERPPLQAANDLAHVLREQKRRHMDVERDHRLVSSIGARHRRLKELPP